MPHTERGSHRCWRPKIEKSEGLGRRPAGQAPAKDNQVCQFAPPQLTFPLKNQPIPPSQAAPTLTQREKTSFSSSAGGSVKMPGTPRTTGQKSLFLLPPIKRRGSPPFNWRPYLGTPRSKRGISPEKRHGRPVMKPTAVLNNCPS